MKKKLQPNRAGVLLGLALVCFSANHLFSIKINPHSMDELKAQVVFSNQPFEGQTPSGKIVTEFKAWDEIYARVNFPQPVKEMLTGYFAGGLLNEGALLNFELKLEGTSETFSGVNKKLNKEDLEKNYIDFDIAPGITRSRDAYIVDFSNGVAVRNSAFEERKKGNFSLSVYFLNSAHERIEEQYISGSFSLDYSALPDGIDGIDKLNAWARQIATAAQEEQVKNNLKKNAQKPTIVFSRLPFSDPAHIPVNRIKAGEPLYGRITLDKPLKEYVEREMPNMIHIDIKCLNDNVYGLGVDKTLRKSEFENAYIDFDIYPTPENAKDVYSSNLGFYYTIYATGLNPGKVLQFEISLSPDYNTSNHGFKKMEGWGEIEIDYTGMPAAKISELNEKGRDAGEKAEANADLLTAAEGAELVKKLPLPVVFTRPSKTGYKGYSNATITQMIREKFHTTEVYMLTFDEPDGAGDFSSLTDLNNYPTEKLGNHVFYFVFKDPVDGRYKFSGGRLRMLYEGNGRYGEAYVFPYSPVMSGEPEFPVDMIRYKQGFESVFFFDAAKLRK